MQKDMLYEAARNFLELVPRFKKWEQTHVDKLAEEITEIAQEYDYPIEEIVKGMRKAWGYYRKRHRFARRKDVVFCVKMGLIGQRIDLFSKEDAVDTLARAVKRFVETQIKLKHRKK